MNGVKHSGSRESILVVADSFFPVRFHDRADDEKGVKIPLAYTSLVEAVAALGSMAGTIIVDCFQSLLDDLTVTENTYLIISPRGHVAIASTKTLTINGKVTILTSAPFAGPGSVAYGANAMRNVMGPANMIGMAGKAPVINAGEDGFVWGAVGGGGGGATWGDITGTLANQADLDAALDEKAPASHAHPESEVTNLVTDLAGKAASSHGHGPSEITGTAVVTADSRLSDDRIPTSHGNTKHTSAFITAGDVHSNANDPVAGEKAALAGTSGTPGSGNKYVTDGDARNTDARTPVAHNHAATDINSATLDGDRLPALSATKKGGAPATGTPSGKYLKDDGTWASPAGGSLTPDVSYFRHYGTGTYEAWFTSPRAGTALAGTALAAARMYAMPFISPRAITLDQIGAYVSTLSTTTARLGIYSDNGNCYPGSLLLDAGTIDVTSTGAKKIAINQALAANTLYWLVIVCAATPAIYCIPVAAVISILGTSNALGTAQNAGLYVAQTYGALPGTFPASPTMIAAAPIPAIFVRLSA